jgi:proline racemase
MAEKKWKPPKKWLKITTIDAHTEGEPLRIITDGFPDLQGKTILARRRYCQKNLDHLRTALVWEPRGHADMYGCILTPPVTPEADIGVVFIHNEGYSTMCGHGIIAVATVVLETGMLPMNSPITTIKIDTPAGLVTAHAKLDRRRVRSVAFQNVPSFVLALDERINVPALGKISYDLAFGGAFYAYVQAKEVGLTCTPGRFRDLIEKGIAIKRAVMASRAIVHPFEKDLNFLYGTIFICSSLSKGADSRNVCIFAEGEVDRSPTGTGVSGRLAILHARHKIALNQQIVIESIIGTRFKGRIVDTTTFGPYQAVIPEVKGTAYITGRHEFLIDPEDPLRNGFILR